MAERTYYDILDVEPEARPAEIKAAYRRLAKLYHPDANKSHEAAERFVEINTAYNVLMNAETREEYDMTGEVQGTDPIGVQKSIILTLAECLDSLLDMPEFAEYSAHGGGVVKLIASLVTQRRKEMEELKYTFERKIREMRRMRSLISRRGEDENLFVSAIDRKLKEHGEELAEINKHVFVLSRCAEELEFYDDVNDFFRAMQASAHAFGEKTAPEPLIKILAQWE